MHPRAPRTAKGRIWNLVTLERGPLHSSVPSSVRKKIKRGLPATVSLITLSSLVSLSPSSSLSLFLSPKIYHIWYFYHLLPPFVPTHFLVILFLAYLPIFFLLWVSKGSYGESWKETQALLGGDLSSPPCSFPFFGTQR